MIDRPTVSQSLHPAKNYINNQLPNYNTIDKENICGVKNPHQDLVKQLIKLCAETHLNAADCRQCAWVTHKNEPPLLSKAASPVEKRKEISTAGYGK